MDSVQFDVFWNGIQEYVLSEYNVGKRQHYNFTAMNALFMLLKILKHEGNWKIISRFFKLKAPTFARIIFKFVSLIVDKNRFYRCSSKWLPHGKIDSKQQLFSIFPESRYSVNVTFQPAFTPSVVVEKWKSFYSRMLKLFGYKVELLVFPNGLAIGLSTLSRAGLRFWDFSTLHDLAQSIALEIWCWEKHAWQQHPFWLL